MSSSPDDPAAPKGSSDVHEDPETEAPDAERVSVREAATVIPGSARGERGEPRAAVPTLGAPATPRLTAEELASSIELDDIDEATAQRLIAAAIRRLHRGTPEAQAERAFADQDPHDASADGTTLAWELVRSTPAPGNTQMKAPSVAAGFRVAGDAPPAFRAEVPSGWIYLIDGVPVFVPYPAD